MRMDGKVGNAGWPSGGVKGYVRNEFACGIAEAKTGEVVNCKREDLMHVAMVPASRAALWVLPGMWWKVEISLAEL